MGFVIPRMPTVTPTKKGKNKFWSQAYCTIISNHNLRRMQTYFTKILSSDQGTTALEDTTASHSTAAGGKELTNLNRNCGDPNTFTSFILGIWQRLLEIHTQNKIKFYPLIQISETIHVHILVHKSSAYTDRRYFFNSRHLNTSVITKGSRCFSQFLAFVMNVLQANDRQTDHETPEVFGKHVNMVAFVTWASQSGTYWQHPAKMELNASKKVTKL